MKKYLLAVLALGATMMMACEPANKGGNDDVKADYELTAENVFQATLDYGGDWYGEGTDNGMIMLTSIDDPTMQNVTKMSALLLDYVLPVKEVFDGCGTLKPGINALEANDQPVAPGTYVVGVYDEVEDTVYGCGYMELDYTAMAYTVMEPVVDGEFTVALEGEAYTVKGLLTLGNGKTVKVNYKGALVSSIAPLSRVSRPKHAAAAFASFLNK